MYSENFRPSKNEFFEIIFLEISELDPDTYTDSDLSLSNINFAHLLHNKQSSSKINMLVGFSINKGLVLQDQLQHELHLFCFQLL